MAHAHQTTPSVEEPLDAWHTHTADEGAPMQSSTDEVPAFRVLAWGMILYMAVVAVVVIITIYFFAYAHSLQINSEEYPEKFAGGAPIQRSGLAPKEEAFGRFTSSQSAWVDVEAGTVRLSMDAAKKKVIEQYSRR
jgi:hypothetical protein